MRSEEFVAEEREPLCPKAALSGSSPFDAPVAPWRKILYEKQAFPDNYVDLHTFLDGRLAAEPLSEADNARTDTADTLTPKFWPIFVATSVIVREIAVVGAFLGIYKHARWHQEDCFVPLCVLDVALGVTGYAFHHQTWRQLVKSLPELAHNGFLLGCLLRILTPLLHTLTAPYSTNTIHALAIVFSTVHLLTFDYAFVTGDRDTYRGVLSMNAAILVAILCVSRLKDLSANCAFLLLAVLLFGLFPWTARRMREHSVQLDLFFTVALCIGTGVLLALADRVLLIVFAITVLLVWFICPYGISCMHKRHDIRRFYRGAW